MAIFKHKTSSKYHYRFMCQGKIYTGSTHTDIKKRAVEYELKKKEEVYQAQYLADPNAPKEKSIALGDAIRKYVWATRTQKQHTNYDINGRKLLGHKKDPATHKVVQVFGFDRTMHFDKLTNGDIYQLVLARRSEGLADATIIHELNFISVLAKNIKRMGFKVPELNFKEVKKDAKLKAAKGRIRYLTKDEEAALLRELSLDEGPASDAAYMHRYDTYHFTILLLDLGCRHGELAALKWSDVDLDRGTVRLFRPKVDNESTLFLTDRSTAVLKERMESRAPDATYVFPAKDGSPRKYTRKAFTSACKRAGLTDVSFHVLRHTACTRLVQSGLSLYAVQQLVGHTTSTTTARYAHLTTSEASAGAVQILNNFNQKG